MQILLIVFALLTGICMFILFCLFYKYVQYKEQAFEQEQKKELLKNTQKAIIIQNQKSASRRMEEQQMQRNNLEIPRPPHENGYGKSSNHYQLPLCFRTLGFSDWPESKKDIKTRFRELAMIHHPDRGGDTEKFQKLSSAYEESLKLFTENIRPGS